MQKINLKRLVKLMVFSQTNLKKKTMIILVMQLLKMEEVDKEALVDLVDLVVQIFQIFLKIFLVILEEVADKALEDVALIIEGQI